MTKPGFTLDYLRSNFDYNPETGEFSRNGRGVGHTYNKIFTAVNVLNRNYFAHRLAWMYVYGEYPSESLLHVNGDRKDNRISNLVCSKQVNPRKDITGSRFGRLTVVEATGDMCWGVNLWRCICDCGNSHIAPVNKLKDGAIKSCGCLRDEVTRAASTKHGDYGSPTYSSWDSMIQRCTNKKQTSYKRYGGVGITVCDRWLKYENFLADMGARPAGMSLDRIDPLGNYEVENCRWASPELQARNRVKRTTALEEAALIRDMYSKGVRPKELEAITGLTRNQIGGVLYVGNVSAPSEYSLPVGLSHKQIGIE